MGIPEFPGNGMRVSKKIMLLYGCFWMLYCTGYDFAAAYIVGCGLRAVDVGVIMAVFGLLSAVLQPVLGQITDRGIRSWRFFLLILSGGVLCVGVALLFCMTRLTNGLLFGLYLMLVGAALPFINSASCYYENRGIRINFGMARGFGSLCCIFELLAMGFIIKRFGVKSIPAAGALFAGLMILAVLSLPVIPGAATVQCPREARRIGVLRRLLRGRAAFVRMLIASTLMMLFFNMTCTYLMQILGSVGGGSEELGICLALSATLELPALFGFSRIRKWASTARLLLVSSFAFVLKAALLLAAKSIGMVYAAQLTQTASYALYAAASVYYVQACAPQEMQVTGQAVMTGTFTVGAVIGNLLGGWMIDLFGVRAMLVMGLLTAVAAAVLVASAQKMPNEANALP